MSARGVAVPSANLAVRKASLSNSSPGAGNHSPQPGAHGGRLQAVPLWFSFRKDRSQGTGGPDCQSRRGGAGTTDRKSTRLNSSHRCISYAVFCLKKKKNINKHKEKKNAQFQCHMRASRASAG